MLVDASRQQVEADFTGITLRGIEIGCECLVRFSLRVLDHAQAEQRFGIVLVEFNRALEFHFSARGVIFLFEEQPPQNNVETGILRVFSKLRVRDRHRFVGLLLDQVHVEHAAQSITGIRILIECLLKGPLRIGRPVLGYPQVTELHVCRCIVRRLFERPLDVVLGAGELLAIDISDRAQQVSVRRIRLLADDLVGFERQSRRVTAPDGCSRQSAMGIHQFRTQAHGFAPFGFRLAEVSSLVERQPEVMMSDGIAWLVL